MPQDPAARPHGVDAVGDERVVSFPAPVCLKEGGGTVHILQRQPLLLLVLCVLLQLLVHPIHQRLVPAAGPAAEVSKRNPSLKGDGSGGRGQTCC
jgi:hypothetical protein